MLDRGISVPCGVIQGIFTSEYIVRIPNSEKPLWEGIIDKEMVTNLKGTSTEEKYIDGRIYAYLISYEDENAIIELPVEGNRRIRVPSHFIEKTRVPA
jgi:hypothetical protein